MAKIGTQWNDLVTTASKWLVTRGLNCQTFEPTVNENVVNFIYESRIGDETFVINLELDRSHNLVEMLQSIPIEIPVAKRQAVATLVFLINADIHLGCFDLGNAHERIRFRCGQDLTDCVLNSKMLDTMHALTISSIERYVPAVMSVAFADQSPAQAHAALNQLETLDSIAQYCNACDIDVSDWVQLPGTVCLQKWAHELKRAIEDCSSQDIWLLVGHGALIEHEDTKKAKFMFQHVARDAGMRLISVPEDSVVSLPSGSPNPFAALAPVMVFLEGDSWMRASSSENGKPNTESELANVEFHIRLLNQLHAFDPQHPVVFVATAKDLLEAPADLRSVGAMDRRFSVALPPMDFVGNGFIEQIGRNHCAPSLTDAPQKVGHFVSNHKSDRTRDLSAMAMRRLSHQQSRRVEFIDLVSFCVRGTVESDAEVPADDSIRRQVAFHEAGHALIAMLDSNGQNIPEYCTIVAGSNFQGLVVESSAFQQRVDAHLTYRDARHKIRISLAGRAAEHVYAGSENVSSGAAADIEAATRYATNVFANFGFAPNMDREQNAGSNLLVICDEATSSECEHVVKLTRGFLAEQYEVVFQVLKEKRELLGVIADRLMNTAVMDQAELSQIYEKFVLHH